jgi:gamma-glutamyltranspeptidase/glutathione hydrolase
MSHSNSSSVNRRQFFSHAAGVSAMAGAAAAGLSQIACGTPAPASSATGQSGAPSGAGQSGGQNVGGPPEAPDAWFTGGRAGRSVVRARHGMVATSQPLASQTGLEILKRGGNAVDAAIAMAAVLNVTEPNMTGIGGDAFMLVWDAKAKKLSGLNASGRAPKALNVEHFKAKNLTAIPFTGMEPITVPGAFDGWVTLLDKFGTMKLADLLGPAITYADEGFPLGETIAQDWAPEVPRLKQTAAAAATFLVDGAAPRPGAIVTQKNLARTLRVLAKGGRDAFYTGEIAKMITDYCQREKGFLTMEDFAAQKSNWVDPISTTYRGHTLYEIPPNGQGLTALLLLNILEGLDLASMRTEPVRYYHTLIEAIKIAFADRNRYIADPAFSKAPVETLISKEYAAKRRALLNADKAIDPPSYGDINVGSDTTYFTVVDKDRNAVSFINSIFHSFGSAIVAGETGIVMQNRGGGFSLEDGHPNRLEPGKRPFHTIIPAMVFKDDRLLMSYGVMGGDIQPQAHAQVLLNLIDRGMNLQQAIDAPRVRYISGRGVMMEDALTAPVIGDLVRRGHERIMPGPGLTHRALMGGGQAIMIDPETDALLGASDPRKDGQAVGY